MYKIKIFLILFKTSNTKPGELKVLPTALPGPESNGNAQKNLTGSVTMKAKFINAINAFSKYVNAGRTLYLPNEDIELLPLSFSLGSTYFMSS